MTELHPNLIKINGSLSTDLQERWTWCVCDHILSPLHGFSEHICLFITKLITGQDGSTYNLTLHLNGISFSLDST